MLFWVRQFFSDARAHKDAAEEVFIVCVISLIPLLLLAVIDQLKVKDAALFDVTGAIWSAISAGQLYLYSFSLFGTLFWLCQKEHENFDKFPPRKYLMLVAFFPTVVIVAVYTFDPTMLKPIPRGLVVASIVVYLIYVVLYYILTVFDNTRAPTVEEQLVSGANQLEVTYQSRTRGPDNG